MKNKVIRVLLVDDHPVVRSGYRRLLDANGDIVVVAEASDGKSAIQSYFSQSPDVVIMDVSMPDMSGIEAARRILERSPDARILIFTMYDDYTTLTQAMAAGILGFVTKRASAEIMLLAIHKIAKQELFIDPDLGKLLFTRGC